MGFAYQHMIPYLIDISTTRVVHNRERERERESSEHRFINVVTFLYLTRVYTDESRTWYKTVEITFKISFVWIVFM